MRIPGDHVNYQISVAPGTVRPVRLRIGAHKFMMSTVEAIDVAFQLVDLVEVLKEGSQDAE